VRINGRESPSDKVETFGRCARNDGVVGVCSPTHLIQNGIEELGDGAAGFEDGVAMVHGADEIGVGKGDAAEWRGAENFARRGIAVRTEEEAGLRT